MAFEATFELRRHRHCQSTRAHSRPFPAPAIPAPSRPVPQALPPDAPVLVLLPGLTGGSGDSYVLHAVASARRAGIRAVVFNSRGTADSPVTTPQFYSASFTGDTRWGQARGRSGAGQVTHRHSCSCHGGYVVERRGARTLWTWMMLRQVWNGIWLKGRRALRSWTVSPDVANRRNAVP